MARIMRNLNTNTLDNGVVLMNSKVSHKPNAGLRPRVKPKTEDPYYVPGLSHPLNGVYPRALTEAAVPARS